MAEPSATARQTPEGIPLEDGFSTKVTFQGDPSVELWEKTVKPPGYDGGEKIELTNMHNVLYRTFAPRALITLTPCTFAAFYDPEAYTKLLGMMNQNQVITVTLPDGTTVAFWGFLKGFELADHVEGTAPEATCTIEPTNYDGTAEQAPVVVEVSGT